MHYVTGKIKQTTDKKLKVIWNQLKPFPNKDTTVYKMPSPSLTYYDEITNMDLETYKMLGEKYVRKYEAFYLYNTITASNTTTNSTPYTYTAYNPYYVDKSQLKDAGENNEESS